MKQGMLNAIWAALTGLGMLGGGAAFAQDRDRNRDQDADQDRTAQQDRIQDRDQDRIADTDRLQDRDQDRDRVEGSVELHVQDRDQLRDRAIYGSELMTRQERREYRNRIGEMEEVEEWARFRAEHQTRMMARAQEQGVELPPPFYGQQLMTDQERVQLREQLQSAASEQERERIRAEHRAQMQERAREHEIPLGELE